MFECKDEKEIAIEVIDKLIEINNILEKYQEHFAYRVRDEIVIERKNKTIIKFYHDNPNIRNKITPTGRCGNILSGIIKFRGDIGYSDRR